MSSNFASHLMKMFKRIRDNGDSAHCTGNAYNARLDITLDNGCFCKGFIFCQAFSGSNQMSAFYYSYANMSISALKFKRVLILTLMYLMCCFPLMAVPLLERCCCMSGEQVYRLMNSIASILSGLICSPHL